MKPRMNSSWRIATTRTGLPWSALRSPILSTAIRTERMGMCTSRRFGVTTEK